MKGQRDGTQIPGSPSVESQEIRDMILNTCIEAGLQDALNPLEQVAISLAKRTTRTDSLRSFR